MIQLSQKTYILDMLVKYGVENCKAVDTPLSSNVRLTKAMAPTTPQGRLDMESIRIEKQLVHCYGLRMELDLMWRLQYHR